jgi:Protein of unknown function (DUF2750)
VLARLAGEAAPRVRDELTDDEYEGTRALPAEERYHVFVQRVLSTGEVWVLVDPESNQVGVAHDDEEDVDYMMVWPHARYAAAEATEHFSRHRAESFTLDEWLGNVVPRLEDDGVLVGVFPIWDGGVFAQEAADHAARLQEGLDLLRTSGDG